MVPNPTNPQSLNRYSYVLNRPVRYTDPTGQFAPEDLATYLAAYICSGDPNCTYDKSIDALYASALWQNWVKNDPKWVQVLLEAQAGDIISFGWPRNSADRNLQKSDAPCMGYGQFAITENGTLVVLAEKGDSILDQYTIDCRGHPLAPDERFKTIEDLTYWERAFYDAVEVHGAFGALARRADPYDYLEEAKPILQWNLYPSPSNPWSQWMGRFLAGEVLSVSTSSFLWGRPHRR